MNRLYYNQGFISFCLTQDVGGRGWGKAQSGPGILGGEEGRHVRNYKPMRGKLPLRELGGPSICQVGGGGGERESYNSPLNKPCQVISFLG